MKIENLVTILQISVTSFLDFILILSPLAHRLRSSNPIEYHTRDRGLKFGIIENATWGLDLCYDMICVTREITLCNVTWNITLRNTTVQLIWRHFRVWNSDYRIYRGYYIRLYHINLVIGSPTLECNIWFWVRPH